MWESHTTFCDWAEVLGFVLALIFAWISGEPQLASGWLIADWSNFSPFMVILPMFWPQRRYVLLPIITSCLPQSNTLLTLKAVKQLKTMFMYFLALYVCDVLTEFTPAFAAICNISWVIQVIGTRWQTYPCFPGSDLLLATRDCKCCVEPVAQ